MKKTKILLATLALIVGGYNAFAGTKTVYLKPGSWNTASAWYALYAFKVDGNTWSVFSEINGSGIYKATFDDSYTAYNLVRLRPSTADGYKSDNDGMNWDNKWGQTSDLTETGIVYEMTDADYSASTYTTASLVSLSDASLSNGKYLFKNVATGKYMGPANDWGTRASLIEAAHYNTIDGTALPDGYYKIESQVDNKNNRHYLGVDGSALYLDNAGSTIRIKEVSTGVYALSATDGVYFIGYDGTNSTLVWNLTDPSNANAQWELISVNDASAISAALSGATLKSPKDATFLVKDANFDNKSRYTWEGFTLTKGGNDHNFNVEIWKGTDDSNFDIYQTLTDMPNGLYKLTCQGFYRPGGNDATDATTRNVVLYAGSNTSRLMNINQGAQKRDGSGDGYTRNVNNSGKYAPNGQGDAYTVFSAGGYSNNSLYAIVTNGSLKIGVKKETKIDNDWTCFDNVRLYYYGPQTTVPADMTFMIENPSFESGNMNGWLTVTENVVVNPGSLSDTEVKPVANSVFTNSDGVYIMNYYGWSWSCDPINGIRQTIPDMPAGKYRVEAVIGGWADSWEYRLDVNGTYQKQTPTANYEGLPFSVDVELAEKGDITIIAKMYHTNANKWEACFLKADNFRLYNLDHYYDNLNAAIEDAETKTAQLGFDAGEYAPYENVDALTALQAANAVDQTNTNISWSELGTKVSDLTSATWTPNGSELNAFYDGGFAVPATDETSSNGRVVTGWTSGDNFRQVLGTVGNFAGLNDASEKKAIFSWHGGGSYGSTYGYTMPLNPNTIYALKLKAAGWGTEERSNIKVSVLKDAEGLATYNFGTPTQGITTGLDSYEVNFVTGAAGNYVFTISCDDAKNFVFTDVELKKAIVSINEGIAYTPVAGNANVTLIRTIKANTWNTFCVPFAISNAELTAAFGADVAVAEYFETAEGNSSTVDFETMDTPAIAANTPVLLKTSTAGTSYTFTGRTIVDATPVKAGTNFDFVGTYAPTTYVKTGDYYISANTLYRSLQDNGTYINGTRAYLHDKSSATARIAKFIIDGVEASGIDGIEMGVNNQNGKIYNLNGQEVKNAQKGLYIQNGKKVIVK